MNSSSLSKFIDGEIFPGFLRYTIDTHQISIPGYLLLLEDGQVETTLVTEEGSPDAVAIVDHGVFLNGKLVEPRRLPSTVLFDSTGGQLTLVQTHDSSWSSHLYGSPFQFTLKPRYVIASGLNEKEWKTPVALRAEIGGLAQWMHDSHISRSVSLTTEPRSDETTEEVIVTTRDFSPISYTSGDKEANKPKMLVRMLRAISTDATIDSLEMKFSAVFEVNYPHPMAWEEGRRILEYFQDLLRFLSWHHFTPRNLMGRFLRTPDEDQAFWHDLGLSEPPRAPTSSWLHIFNSHFPSSRKAPNRTDRQFIVSCSEFGPAELDKWLELRQTYSHSFGLISQVIRHSSMSPQVATLQLGAGIESLAFTIEKSATSKNKANSLKAADLFSLVAQPATELLPAAFSDWADRANGAYQAIKHLRREVPDTGELAEINDRTSLVIQIWLARQLGANDTAIQRYVESSPRLRSSYERVPDPSVI